MTKITSFKMTSAEAELLTWLCSRFDATSSEIIRGLILRCGTDQHAPDALVRLAIFERVQLAKGRLTPSQKRRRLRSAGDVQVSPAVFLVAELTHDPVLAL